MIIFQSAEAQSHAAPRLKALIGFVIFYPNIVVNLLFKRLLGFIPPRHLFSGSRADQLLKVAELPPSSFLKPFLNPFKAF